MSVTDREAAPTPASGTPLLSPGTPGRILVPYGQGRIRGLDADELGAHGAAMDGLVALGLPVVPAALLGMITAVGGGMARDVLANRVPVVLEAGTGWYAVPALAGAALAATGLPFGWPTTLVLVPGMVVAFGWRVVSVQRGWAPPPARGIR